MSELIELVFESISKKDILKFTDFILRNGKINLVKYVNTLGEEIVSNHILDKDNDAIEIIKMHHILIKSSILVFENIKIVDADLWIEFQQNVNSVDFLINFSISDLQNFMNHSVPEIMFYANKLSEAFTIKNYYCGLEPALDSETRFFTKTELGPLKVKNLGNWRLP